MLQGGFGLLSHNGNLASTIDMIKGCVLYYICEEGDEDNDVGDIMQEWND